MIGLIPAAGRAERLHGLPKFLLPVGDSYLLDILCRRMKAAGAAHLYIGANSENFDLVRRYATCGAHVYAVDSHTMSETVLAARTYLDLDEDVLFAMPDTYWTAENAFAYFTGRPYVEHEVAMALLWYTLPGQSRTLGVCMTNVGLMDGYRYIRQVIDKPRDIEFGVAWGAIRWQKRFWGFIAPDDPHVGFALQRAIEDDWRVRGFLTYGRYHDCGTLIGYADCLADTPRQTVSV